MSSVMRTLAGDVCDGQLDMICIHASERFIIECLSE
jgi:hypothetical protein